MTLSPEEIEELAALDEALSRGEYPTTVRPGRSIRLPREEDESIEDYLTRLFNTGEES